MSETRSDCPVPPAANLKTPRALQSALVHSGGVAVFKLQYPLLLLTFLGLTNLASAAAPTLTYLFPGGGQRGSTVAVTCTGKFDWPIRIDAPGVVVEPGEKSGQLTITIPSDLAADRVWIRLYNAEGASVAVPFLIGDLREINETEPNNAPQEAESFEQAGLIVNGVLKGADTDSYSVPLEAGQTLVAAIDAHTRLGSPIDTILQVALPNGIVVADNHDDHGLDPRLAFTASTAGRYIVRVFGFSSEPNTNISLQGGDNCVYRLTLTTGPYVTHVVPLSVNADNPGTVEPRGWNIPAGTQAVASPFGAPDAADLLEQEPRTDLRIPLPSRLGFAHREDFAHGGRVRLVPYATSLALPRAGEEPPQRLELPHAVTGCLRTPGQADRFLVSLGKGNPLLLTVEARTLGLPPDPLVRLFDPEGKKVAEIDDSAGTRDAVLAHTAARDGDYTIVVTDRHRAGSERAYYQLTARLDEPDFELTTTGGEFVLPADKPLEVVVNVVRRGAAGPITVAAVDLPEGITAEPAVSETSGDSSKKVTLKLSGNGSPFSGRIRLVGTMSAPRELQHDVRTPARLNGSFSTLWLTAIAAANTSPAEPDKPAK